MKLTNNMNKFKKEIHSIIISGYKVMEREPKVEEVEELFMEYLEEKGFNKEIISKEELKQIINTELIKSKDNQH